MENGFTISPKKPPASLVTLENIVGPSASITEDQYTWNEMSFSPRIRLARCITTWKTVSF